MPFSDTDVEGYGLRAPGLPTCPAPTDWNISLCVSQEDGVLLAVHLAHQATDSYDEYVRDQGITRHQELTALCDYLVLAHADQMRWLADLPKAELRRRGFDAEAVRLLGLWQRANPTWWDTREDSPDVLDACLRLSAMVAANGPEAYLEGVRRVAACIDLTVAYEWVDRFC